nr:hypothetical protein [Tanacetum cinerariifolium]
MWCCNEVDVMRMIVVSGVATTAKMVAAVVRYRDGEKGGRGDGSGGVVDRQEITYTIDMFRDTLKLPGETPCHPFIAPTTLKFIQPFLKIQPQPVKSTQGMNRIPRATRTPNPEDFVQKKRKSKQVVVETSSPRKSLKAVMVILGEKRAKKKKDVKMEQTVQEDIRYSKPYAYISYSPKEIRMNLQGSDEGPSIHKDWLRGTKVFDGGSIGLKGGIGVVEVVVKWSDGGRGGLYEEIEFLHNLIPTHEWLGLSIDPTSSPREVDWWEERFKVHRGSFIEDGVTDHFRIFNGRKVDVGIFIDAIRDGCNGPFGREHAYIFARNTKDLRKFLESETNLNIVDDEDALLFFKESLYGNGLCKGKRLSCKYFDPSVIDAEIAVRQHYGVRVLLQRIPLAPSEEDIPNGEALRKCILSGPYKPTTVLVHVVEATDNSPAVPEHTTLETPSNMSPENKAHFLAEKEAIHLILTGIGDDIYSTVDAFQTAQDVKTNLFWKFGKFTSHDEETMELYYTRFYKLMNEMIRNNLIVTTMHVNVQFLQQLQPEWSKFVTIVKQHKLDEISYHKLFGILKQYQNEVNELHAEKLARNANLLALVATAQASLIDPFYQSSRTSSNSKNKNVDTTPRYKNDDHSGQLGTQRTVNVAGTREKVGSHVVQKTGIQCFNCKEYGHFAKECRKPKSVKDSAYHKEKMMLCKQAEQELEAHYSYMAKIQEVPNADSGTDSEPVEQWKRMTPNSLDMCEDDIQNEQNDVESDDERVALANLISNLKLDVDENKKIQKQFKKTKQTEFEKYKAFNDRTVDYEKLEHKLNESLGQIAHKDTVIREGLKTKAYELSVVKEKHDELMKQSLLTKSHYEGLVKQKTKAEFSDMYDVILHGCVSKDVMCSYLQSLSDLDALAELQCMYLHKVKECDCLAQKLSKQTESASKKVHNELLQRFAKVEKHSISLEIALKNCKERVRNDTVCNEKASNVFQKEREQYFEIQDLKAQMQDKNIAITELKKLIKKDKGRSVDTKFDRPSVVRQPNAQRIPKPSVLGKPTRFSNSLERRYFPKTKSVLKTNVSEGLSKPVTAQTLPQEVKKVVSNTNVLRPGMYRINNRTSHTRAPQSPQTVKNTNIHMSTSTGVNHKPNVSSP